MSVAAGAPEVSVVLSTYNRAHVLPRALDSLAQQSFPPECYEVLIVDNNSNDGTRQIGESFCARFSHFRYVFEPKQGLSHARNTGIRVARASLIAFTDDDVRASSDWVSTIADLAGSPAPLAHPRALGAPRSVGLRRCARTHRGRPAALPHRSQLRVPKGGLRSDRVVLPPRAGRRPGSCDRGSRAPAAAMARRWAVPLLSGARDHRRDRCRP